MSDPPTLPIAVSFEPPSHGWLPVSLKVGTQVVEIDASDVPNNPVAELLDAIDLAAHRVASRRWWHLEPAGYSMYFTPKVDAVHFRLDLSPDSNPGRGRTVLQTIGSRARVLMPFWRFLRDFQSRGYTEPDWPPTELARIDIVKTRINQP